MRGWGGFRSAGTLPAPFLGCSLPVASSFLLLLILTSGFPHPLSPHGGAPGCQPPRFQASFLENRWTVSLFLSLFKSRSRCCLGSVASHGPVGVPVPTVTAHVGLALSHHSPEASQAGKLVFRKGEVGQMAQRASVPTSTQNQGAVLCPAPACPPLSDRANTVSCKSRRCMLAVRPAVNKVVEGNDDMHPSSLPGVTHCAGPSTIALHPNSDNSNSHDGPASGDLSSSAAL